MRKSGPVHPGDATLVVIFKLRGGRPHSPCGCLRSRFIDQKHVCPRRVQILRHPLRPFRQHLKRVLRAERHDRENPVDELEGHRLVEQIRHRIHKHPPRLAPAQRIGQPKIQRPHLTGEHRPPRTHLCNPDHITVPGLAVPPDKATEVGLIRLLTHRLQPPSHRRCVAVEAPRRDRRAADHWIPGRIGPLDVAHTPTPIDPAVQGLAAPAAPPRDSRNFLSFSNCSAKYSVSCRCSHIAIDRTSRR